MQIPGVNPVTTTRAEATVILRAAHAANALPAQHGEAGTYYTVLDGKPLRCAIGQLFPVDEAEKLENYCSHGQKYLMAAELIEQGQLIVDDPDWFVKVQKVHDEWTDDYEKESEFLALLQT